MDTTVIDFHKEGKLSECSAALQKITHQELKKFIDSRVLKSRGDPGELIRSVLYGSPSNTRDGQERRLFVFKHCVALLQSNELSSKLSSELVGILLLETDELTATNLADLSTVFVDAIKSGTEKCGKSLEIFPKILSALATRPVVTQGNQEMSGEVFKSHVLNDLNSGRWDPSSVTHLAAMFKDIPLSSDELGFVIEKLIRAFHVLDLQELPPLVYQMLLLSNKGHKRMVLEGVTSFFSSKDDAAMQKEKDDDDDELSESPDSDSQLPHVEGTIILHITYAIKQDPDLGREFVKFLKSQQHVSPASVLAPFNVAMALSVARIHRFEDQIMDLLKGAVLQSFKDFERQKSSQWVQEMVPGKRDICNLLVRTVNNSAHGWDHVSQGLVDLGFVLMDSFGPRGVFGKIPSEINPSCHHTPVQKSCQLGATILKEIFKSQEVVRADILEQILNRVVTKATAPVSHYLDLLASTVKSAPQILLDSLPKVREAFDYLSFLPPPTAVGFMRAILPLMKISVGLKDGLMLTLRKALFSRQLESRKIATSGFLMLLSRFKMLGGLPASQASMSFSASQLTGIDVHTTFSSKMSEAVCLEILGSMRRCLSQQADVRLTLYEGIFDVLYQNTSLGLPIIHLLKTQFRCYYEDKQDIQPPIKLEPCIIAQNDQVFLGEPMAHLLCTLIHCLIKTKEVGATENESETYEDTISETEDILESLCRRFMKSELEDFELDRAADFSNTTSVGIKNNIYTILTMGCYEGLIEYNFLSSDFEPASMQNLLQLHATYQKLSELIKDKSQGGGGGKRGRPTGGPASTKLASHSMLSLNVVEQILRALYSDSSPSHQEAIDILQSKPEFGRYILNVMLQKVSQVNDKGWCDGPHGQDPAKIFQYCSGIARTLNQYYMDNIRRDEKSKDKKKVAVLCLEGMATIINMICDRYTHRIPEFLQTLDDSSDSVEEDLIHEHIKRFQKLAVSILTSEDDDHNPKEALHVFNVIACLSQNLTPGQSQLDQVQSWVQKLAAEQNIDDSVVAKSLVSLLISLSVRQKNMATLLREMAQDIHRVLGDIDQEIEITSESHFVIITPRTAAPTILLQLLSQIDHELEDTDWVISRQQAMLTSAPVADSDQHNETQKEDVDKGICTRLGHFVNIFHELVQSAIPVGPCVDNLVKSVTRLYKSLTLIVKYYLNIYNKRTGHMTTRFEKLVRLSGTNLTQCVYAMITYIQASQSEHLQQTSEKRKKKKDQKMSAVIAAASKAKVLKETRQIPNLIFGIEEYESFLIQLSKKSKVNLMEHMKLSTSRDFRINVAQVTSALEDQGSSSSSDNNSDAENDTTQNDTTQNGGSDQEAADNDRENQEPPSKRSKTDGSSGKSRGGKIKGKGRDLSKSK